MGYPIEAVSACGSFFIVASWLEGDDEPLEVCIISSSFIHFEGGTLLIQHRVYHCSVWLEPTSWIRYGVDNIMISLCIIRNRDMISLPKKQQPTAPTRRDEDECRKGGFLLHASNEVNKKITYCAIVLQTEFVHVACCLGMLPQAQQALSLLFALHEFGLQDSVSLGLSLISHVFP